MKKNLLVTVPVALVFITFSLLFSTDKVSAGVLSVAESGIKAIPGPAVKKAANVSHQPAEKPSSGIEKVSGVTLSSVSSDADTNARFVGLLIVRGHVRVNGKIVATGATVFSGSEIATGPDSYALLNLRKLGLISIRSNTAITLNPTSASGLVNSRSSKGSFKFLPLAKALLDRVLPEHGQTAQPSPSNRESIVGFANLLGKAAKTTVDTVSIQTNGNNDNHSSNGGNGSHGNNGNDGDSDHHGDNDHDDDHHVSPTKPKPPHDHDHDHDHDH